MQVGVTRLGTYGDVKVNWLSTQAKSNVSQGIVYPVSGSVTLTNGQQTAVFSVRVICQFLLK